MRAAMLAVGVLLVAACGDDSDASAPVTAEPDEACVASLEAAASSQDPSVYEPLILRSLDQCSTADEWLDALRTHPGAMGVKGAAHVGTVDLQSACLDAGSAVCADAVAQGLIATP